MMRVDKNGKCTHDILYPNKDETEAVCGYCGEVLKVEQLHVAVIGSRTFSEYSWLKKTLDAMPITHIVSGGAKGADALAKRYTKEEGLKYIERLPDYAHYGRRAPLLRNQRIIDEASTVVAFWDGKSKGTKNALDYARKTNKEIKIVYFGRKK